MCHNFQGIFVVLFRDFVLHSVQWFCLVCYTVCRAKSLRKENINWAALLESEFLQSHCKFLGCFEPNPYNKVYTCTPRGQLGLCNADGVSLLSAVFSEQKQDLPSSPVWHRIDWYINTNGSVASTFGIVTFGVLVKAAKPHRNTGTYVLIYRTSWSRRRKRYSAPLTEPRINKAAICQVSSQVTDIKNQHEGWTTGSEFWFGQKTNLL